LFGNRQERCDGQATASGKEFRIPIQLERLPSHVRMIIDDHVLNYQASDLIDVLTGYSAHIICPGFLMPVLQFIYIGEGMRKLF
jgi:hypothetical protein